MFKQKWLKHQHYTFIKLITTYWRWNWIEFLKF